jgi:hypothetical protein
VSNYLLGFTGSALKGVLFNFYRSHVRDTSQLLKYFPELGISIWERTYSPDMCMSGDVHNVFSFLLVLFYFFPI